MVNNYENFDNLETSIRKSSVIQERVNLVSTHMYKQFLDYQHASLNTNEVFLRMTDDLQAVVETLKQSFSSRGITTQNIYLEVDVQKTVAVINILWHKISFTTRCNFQPQALFRGNEVSPLFSSRIMAVKGSYYELMKNIKDDEMEILLDNEIASLFVPPDKTQNSIMTIRHLANKEFFLNQMDAPREFVLKVTETVCGGGVYHEMGTRKTFNI
ncbi:MAG TPA: hypothetical protein PLG15_02660 [Candidatus Gastranaerophilaceae bacterium]|nr:hypothetical protein [Candidatus Gastranaerophilaceae bacterium]HPT41265.1 hypothetical protein [Candidatus Gastranaerophilaceae bacterium]